MAARLVARKDVVKLRFSVLLSMLGALGCASPDPHAELEQLAADAELAAEARDTGFFREHISERYSDARGRDRDELINLIRAFFLTHARLELVTRIERIAPSGEDAAEMTVLLGMVGQRGASLIGGLEGELERLELELVREDGEWRVIGSTLPGRE